MQADKNTDDGITKNLPALANSLAIIAGSGDLPRLIALECEQTGQPFQVVQYEGVDLPWVNSMPTIHAIYEKPGKLFKELAEKKCKKVTFAGAMKRPKLRPLRFDWKFIRLSPTLLPALKKGDDETLAAITKIFEAEQIEIIAPHDLLEGLLAPEGILSQKKPTDEHSEDVKRALEIVKKLGQVDVGQGAVVAQGICLATESIQGTDHMLASLGENVSDYLPNEEGSKGILYKAPKPGQDWRVDLPAIGLDTIFAAKTAGIDGVVVEAGGVLVLGLEETIQAADDAGIILWGRASDDHVKDISDIDDNLDQELDRGA